VNDPKAALGTRINVVGCSGSGKSTLAKSLADLLDLPFVELDSFQHQAGWRQASREEFLAQVHVATQGDRWVIDGNYSVIRPTIWPRVETIIWLDHSFASCFSRVWRRTFRRWLRREVLWNGNREHILHHFFTRDSLLLWVIRTHRKKRCELGGLFASQELRGKQLIRFGSPGQAESWLRDLKLAIPTRPEQEPSRPVKIEA
jgi:adenylate kinase family enzyme